MKNNLFRFLSRPVGTKFGFLLVFLAALSLGFCAIYQYTPPFSLPPILPWLHRPINQVPAPIEGLEKFSSESNFKTYLEEAETSYMYAGISAMDGMGAGRWNELAVPAPMIGAEGTKEAMPPERVSETTVQVLGVDEPDIVKTNGKEIYFSPGESYYLERFMAVEWFEESTKKIVGETKVIKAFPPADLTTKSKIEKTGDLLLDKDILVIFSGQEILGYDISVPEQPQQKWKIELEDNNYVAGARLYKGQIYLVTGTSISTEHPCPIRPLTLGGAPLIIECTDIYHPIVPVPVDVTYNAMVLNPEDGGIKSALSFVGSSSGSVVYMSEKGIYITYSYYESTIKFFSGFLKEKCQDIIPAWVLEKLEKLEGYDISESAKITELTVILEQYQNSLSNDERMRVENELTNRMERYYQEHKRDFEKTGITKISLEGLQVSATGNVPGKPLNQFSLDEYQGYLRIATTIGGGWGFVSGIGESANDVYVLDGNLTITGSVKELGLTERIYSVRFIEDKGYVVTFRQTDPFYVLDLSEPTKPELKGELKIPGYSSYLHPLTKDKILGIGKSGSEVKISLFDVSSPENPTEKDKYVLNEYWSDILNTHHAFLLDTKHQIFFLPGSKGGYVFSYKDDKLGLARTVSDIAAKRAIYINDYLYIIGDDKITVLNEMDWEKVNELAF